MIYVIKHQTFCCNFFSGDPVDTVPVHLLLLSVGILCIENMNMNVARVPASGAHAFNLPMKIKGGTGAPTRFYAIDNANIYTNEEIRAISSASHLSSTLAYVLYVFAVFAIIV